MFLQQRDRFLFVCLFLVFFFIIILKIIHFYHLSFRLWFTASDYPFSIFKRFFCTFMEPSRSLSYGRWICNYLCNQCLSPLMLWVRISTGRDVQHYVIKFVSDLRQIGYFLRVLRLPPPMLNTIALTLVPLSHWCLPISTDYVDSTLWLFVFFILVVLLTITV